jgi:hypothetical protein
MRAVLPNVFHCGISFLVLSCWSEVTSCSVVVYSWFPFFVALCIYYYGSGICALVVLWCVILAGGALSVWCFWKRNSQH